MLFLFPISIIKYSRVNICRQDRMKKTHQKAVGSAKWEEKI